MNAGGRAVPRDSGPEVDTEADAADGEVLADGLSPRAFERFAQACSTAWLGRHQTVVTRTIAALGIAAGLAATVFALRPPAVEPVPSAHVTGVSIEVPPPRPGGADARPIVATYRVTAVGSGTHVTVIGVTGPFIRASEARAIAGAIAGGDEKFSVSSVPDCSDASSLDATRVPYLVAVTRTSSDGRSASGRVHVRKSPVDWGAAIRQDCWQRTAADGIAIDGLQAERDRDSRQLVLTVTLHSAIPGDVGVRVIDIADVATLDAADSGTLRAGADRVFRVRWPTADCSLPVLPYSNVSPGGRSGRGFDSPALAWSVGPVGADPAALFTTVLSPSQLRTIRESAQQLCEPSVASRAPGPEPFARDRLGPASYVR